MKLTTEISLEATTETLSLSSSQVPPELSSLATILSNFSNFSWPTSPPTDLSSAIRTAYLVVGIVGVIGNLQVTVVMFSYKPLRQRLANYFLANQCVIDLLLSAIVILYAVDTADVMDGVIGELTCRLWRNRCIFLGFFASSLFSIVALTIERYTEIVYPIQHKLRLTRRLVVYCLVVINAAGVVFKVSFIAPTSGLVNGVCVTGLYPNIYIKRFVGLMNFMVEFFLPLTAIGYCYVGMAQSLNKKIQPMSGKTWNHARKNILKTLLFVVMVFVVCTTFKQIVTLLFFLDIDSLSSVSSEIGSIATVLAYSNCCFNPLVYFFKYEEFKRGLRWLYCRRRIKFRNRTVLPSSNYCAETKITSERY